MSQRLSVHKQLGTSVFKSCNLANYKHLCGEYSTSSSFALWLLRSRYRSVEGSRQRLSRQLSLRTQPPERLNCTDNSCLGNDGSRNRSAAVCEASAAARNMQFCATMLRLGPLLSSTRRAHLLVRRMGQSSSFALVLVGRSCRSAPYSTESFRLSGALGETRPAVCEGQNTRPTSWLPCLELNWRPVTASPFAIS